MQDGYKFMENKELLRRFFELENRRDWTAYETFLHSDIEWILYHEGGSQVISGVENYMNKIRTAYYGNHDTFLCEAFFSSTSGDRITAILINNHGKRSTDIFEFENGLIRREWEFLLG